MSYVTFNKKNSNFFDEIKEKIDNYFSYNKIERTGDYRVYLKSLLFLLLAIGSYSAIVFFSLPAWIFVIFCSLLGVSLAGIGFNIMHDSAHGSYSNKRWLNEIASYSLNLIGGNVFIWKNKHNVNHHTYTNIKDLDDDIDIEPWLRTHLNQPRRWYHRYQHIYGLGLYGLTYLNWVYAGDFKKYFSKKIAITALNKMSFKEHVIFWVSKILTFCTFLIIPIIKIGFWKTVIGYSIASLICGLILGIIFQLAHLTQDSEFPIPQKNSNKVEKDWVLYQLSTTVNFAINNKFIFWFTGGLNFQVVHHLFPRISHIHYPQINALIRETCNKFNIKYTEYPSFWSAFRSHISFLKQMGSKN